MNSRFRFNIVVSILAISVILLGGCREHTLISSNLSPASDTAGVRADTLRCITHTYYNDNVVTSYNVSGLPEYAAVGSLVDSFAGTMSGSAFFQIANSLGLLAIDTAVHVDSVVLNMPYSGFSYGDTALTTATQSFQIFYLDDTLGYNTTYFSSSNKSLDIAYPLSDPTTVNLYHLKDSVSDGNGVKHHPAMRIKLRTSTVMNRLYNAIYQGSTASDPLAAFIGGFKGICVRPADARQTTKVIPYFTLNGSDDYSKAGVLVYYHTLTYPDSAMHYAFSHEQGDCAHFNNITRSYSRYPINNLIHSSQANDSVIAIQNQPGASIDVVVTGLKSIPKNVVINKAELQLSVLPTLASSIFFPHDQIYPDGVGNGTWPAGTDAGAEYTVLDRYPLASTSAYAVLDGTPHTFTYGTTNVSTYTIGLPREVIASIAAGNDTLHYHVRGTQLLYGAYRTILGGGNYSDPKYRAKLIVVYSSLKK